MMREGGIEPSIGRSCESAMIDAKGTYALEITTGDKMRCVTHKYDACMYYVHAHTVSTLNRSFLTMRNNVSKQTDKNVCSVHGTFCT